MYILIWIVTITNTHTLTNGRTFGVTDSKTYTLEMTSKRTCNDMKKWILSNTPGTVVAECKQK